MTGVTGQPGARPHSTEPAFDEFFEQHATAVVRALGVLSGSREEAEDVTQEAFVRVYERWPKVRGGSNPAGYLYRTAVNLLRSRRRRRPPTGSRPPDPQRQDPAEEAGRRDVLRRALSGLPAGQREAVVLSAVLGLSDVEVAEVLGVSPGAVRVRLSRGRDRLRRSLTEAMHA